MKKKNRCFILENNGYILSSFSFYSKILPIHLINYLNESSNFFPNFHFYRVQHYFYEVNSEYFDPSHLPFEKGNFK